MNHKPDGPDFNQEVNLHADTIAERFDAAAGKSGELPEEPMTPPDGWPMDPHLRVWQRYSYSLRAVAEGLVGQVERLTKTRTDHFFKIGQLEQRAQAAEQSAAKMREDAGRYRWLRDTLHNAVGAGIEVNDQRLVYEEPVPGEEVRVYWYPNTPVGFNQTLGSTLDEAIDAALAEGEVSKGAADEPR